MHVAVAAPPAARAIPPWWEPNLDPAPDEPEAGWPLLATPVPAGFPAPANDFVERHLRSLDDHLIRHPESTFLIRVAGDALALEGIHDGDLRVVDRAGPATTGSIVVAVVDGALSPWAAWPATPKAGGWCSPPIPPLPTGRPGDGQDPILWGVVRWAIHRLWPGRNWAGPPDGFRSTRNGFTPRQVTRTNKQGDDARRVWRERTDDPRRRSGPPLLRGAVQLGDPRTLNKLFQARR